MAIGAVELFRCANPRALARAAASQWLDVVAAVAGENRRFFAGLSGGRIARDFFQAVAELASERGGALKHTHFFWADERCVPPTDAASNFAMAQQFLFRPLQIGDEQVHRIPGELPPAEAARLAAAEMCQVAPLDTAPMPVLDLILLGMGEDGHVASLFPGMSTEARYEHSLYLPVQSPKPPPQRITLNYAPIAAARAAWVLASGPGKERALAESLSTAGTTPLARIIRQRATTRVYTDIPGHESWGGKGDSPRA